MEHKHAKLLRMAADNADQLFECDGCNESPIDTVLNHPQLNWRPVPKPKKMIKRWLWCTDEGAVSFKIYSDDEIEAENKKRCRQYTTKLLWSETEFEVEVGINADDEWQEEGGYYAEDAFIDYWMPLPNPPQAMSEKG